LEVLLGEIFFIFIILIKMITKIYSWYETGLPARERKRRGHFSTPADLVKSILDACGYTPEADLLEVRVLDPACGSGNFLREAAHRLLTCGRLRGMDQAARAALMQRNLWGFDPDPIACFLAEMQLRAALDVEEDSSSETSPLQILPLRCPFAALRASAHQGFGSHAQDDMKGAQGDNTLPSLVVKNHLGLHIHQADALTLPWETSVDLVVGNPPYLAAKNNDLSGYQFAQQRGQADSYLLFLSLALQALRPNGWMGLVLPDPVLARANAAREREHLLKEVTIHHIWHLSNVFAANVGAVVIIAQKCPPRSIHQVSWVRGKWQNTLSSGCKIPQSLFQRQPGAEMRYLLNSDRGSIIERLRQQMDEPHGRTQDSPHHPAPPPSPQPHRLAPLGEFLTISRGEELGKNSQFITTSIDVVPIARKEIDRFYPVLLGGIDIRPYTIPKATHWIAREAVGKPLERYLSNKLLVVKSTDRLQAALDVQGHVALQTLYLLHPRTRDISEDDLFFFLALLNSRLLREYVYMLHTAYKWVQPQIEQSILAHLPIPLNEFPTINRGTTGREIIQMARLLEDACSREGPVVEWKKDTYSIYEELERAICALYETVVPGLFK
jgi:SAM-dependent methyltransferase